MHDTQEATEKKANAVSHPTPAPAAPRRPDRASRHSLLRLPTRLPGARPRVAETVTATTTAVEAFKWGSRAWYVGACVVCRRMHVRMAAVITLAAAMGDVSELGETEFLCRVRSDLGWSRCLKEFHSASPGARLNIPAPIRMCAGHDVPVGSADSAR